MMNLMKLSMLLLVGSGLFLCGCPSREANDTVSCPLSVSAAPMDPAHPVICHLKTRDKLITVCAGEEMALYTVKTHSGAVLAVNLSAMELSTRFPELKGVVEQGIADWAGMDPLDLHQER